MANSNLERQPVCLNLIASVYEKYKQACKEQITTVSQEVNRFMVNEIKKLEKEEKENVY